MGTIAALVVCACGGIRNTSSRMSVTTITAASGCLGHWRVVQQLICMLETTGISTVEGMEGTTGPLLRCIAINWSATPSHRKDRIVTHRKKGPQRDTFQTLTWQI